MLVLWIEGGRDREFHLIRTGRELPVSHQNGQIKPTTWDHCTSSVCTAWPSLCHQETMYGAFGWVMWVRQKRTNVLWPHLHECEGKTENELVLWRAVSSGAGRPPGSWAKTAPPGKWTFYTFAMGHPDTALRAGSASLDSVKEAACRLAIDTGTERWSPPASTHQSSLWQPSGSFPFVFINSVSFFPPQNTSPGFVILYKTPNKVFVCLVILGQNWLTCGI